MVKPIIGVLKEGSSKEIASDDEFLAIQQEVKTVEYGIERDKVFEEVVNKKRGNHFRKLVSVIATRLVLDFGLKGVELTKIKVQDYDVVNNSIWINGVVLPLSAVYCDSMKLYLEARELAVSKTAILTERLFVNVKGNDFKATKVSDYGALFNIVKKLNGSAGMEMYAYNRILKMFASGVDINTIVQLTGFSREKIFELLDYYNDEIIGLNPNVYFSTPTENELDVKNSYGKIKYYNCPVCNKLITTEASEWVVVMYEDSEIPVLACKYCGGVYAEGYI